MIERAKTIEYTKHYILDEDMDVVYHKVKKPMISEVV